MRVRIVDFILVDVLLLELHILDCALRGETGLRIIREGLVNLMVKLLDFFLKDLEKLLANHEIDMDSAKGLDDLML